MFKKLVVGAGVALAAVGGPVAFGAGTAGAAPPPVTLSGAATCAATGLMTFGAPLTNNPSSQVKVRVRVAITKCTGVGTTSGAVTLETGTLIAASSTTMLNACGALLDNVALPPLTGRIKWTGKGGGIVGTSVTVTGESGFYDQGRNKFNLHLPVALGTGSFAGQPATFAGLGANQSGSTLSSACSTAKGLKSFSFGHPGRHLTGSLTIAGA